MDRLAAQPRYAGWAPAFDAHHCRRQLRVRCATACNVSGRSRVLHAMPPALYASSLELISPTARCSARGTMDGFSNGLGNNTPPCKRWLRWA